MNTRGAVRFARSAIGGALAAAMMLGGGAAQALDAITRPVVFVGNNWEGSIDVIDASTYQKVGRINGIPDKQARLNEIYLNPVKLAAFLAIRTMIGEGHDQFVDDMYSTPDGKLVVVSRPSFADVVGIDPSTGKIVWRFVVDGIRADHMGLSPNGNELAVSASTGNVVHILDIRTGKELGRFSSGDSPHENVYSKDGRKIFHASIGTVYSPLDAKVFDKTKGERLFQVVDAKSLQVLKRFDMADKLKAAGLSDLSPAVRPMAISPDERYFYFQLSFLHGFIEYDMQEDKITRLARLPNLVPNLAVTQYVNDSAHHGIAINGSGSTLCVAGTMDDYVALVQRDSFNYKLLTGLGQKPYWVTSDKAGKHCYISWSGTDQMSVINYESGKEVARVTVGDHPQRIREGYLPVSWPK